MTEWNPLSLTHTQAVAMFRAWLWARAALTLLVTCLVLGATLYGTDHSSPNHLLPLAFATLPHLALAYAVLRTGLRAVWYVLCSADVITLAMLVLWAPQQMTAAIGVFAWPLLTLEQDWYFGRLVTSETLQDEADGVIAASRKPLLPTPSEETVPPAGMGWAQVQLEFRYWGCVRAAAVLASLLAVEAWDHSTAMALLLWYAPYLASIALQITLIKVPERWVALSLAVLTLLEALASLGMAIAALARNADWALFVWPVVIAGFCVYPDVYLALAVPKLRPGPQVV